MRKRIPTTIVPFLVIGAPLLLVIGAPLLLNPGCNKQETVTEASRRTQPHKSSPPVANPVAVVNGVAIDGAEIGLRSIRRDAYSKKLSARDLRKEVLEAIIRDELVFQKAQFLGLESDPRYLAMISRTAARHRTAQRKAMRQVFEKTEIANLSQISDQEALDFFNRNALDIKTELHVMQIFYKRQPDVIAQVLKDLNKGEPFEVAARRQYPDLKGGGKRPWDLGFLHWDHMPKTWAPALKDLQVGSYSDVVTGKKHRQWILKLVAKREASTVTFETEKNSIKNILQRDRSNTVRETIESQLYEKAKIEYFPLPPVRDY